MGDKIAIKASHGFAALAFVLVGTGAFLLFPQEAPDNTVPKGPIHWHPMISIFINGEQQTIPPNIGITVGKSIDWDVSGMRMSPMHTHDFDGVIHMEQDRPKARTLKLGYFFEVWDKTFSDQCIFEYCNGDGGTVKMFVNGEPNYEFGAYEPKDGDDIVIMYE